MFVSAVAIICYKCPLEDANMTSLIQKGRMEGICSIPTYSVDCSKLKEPLGVDYDACYTVRLSISHKYIGLIKFNILNCGVKALCNWLTDQWCSTLKGKPNLNIKECVGSCCEENFCNQPVNSSSTYVPPNTAILGILGVMAAVLANLNVD